MVRSDSLQEAFLENSSRYLAISSPSTSAHLMAERLALNMDGERASTNDRRENVCNACGTLMILGWNAATTKRQTTSSRKGKRVRKSPRNFIRICQVCHRETVKALPTTSNAPRAAQSKPSASMASQQASETTAGEMKRAQKTSSKQRAKARKERSGLQALLNKSKQSSATSSTLDLMDLMKA